MDVDKIRSIPLFEGLAEDELETCAKWFNEVEMVAGSSLAKQDDYAYKFFVVLDGQVDIHRDFEFVTTLGPGEIFGETALVKHERRNARVTARTRCRLACMMSWDFTAMIELHPVVAERIEAVVHQREA